MIATLSWADKVGLFVTTISAVAAAVVSVIQALKASSQHGETTKGIASNGAGIVEVHALVNDRLDQALSRITDLEAQLAGKKPLT